MLRECKNCGKEFEGTKRASYCSPKCKQSAFRNNSTVTPVTEFTDSVTENVTVTNPKLSKTDSLFQQDAIDRGLGEDWLGFSPITRAPKCDQCKSPFKTQLAMLRYCSPKCRAGAI